MNQKLFNEFEEVSEKAWKQKIQYDLKGADYNDTLVWESPEGIKVKPFYHKDSISDTVSEITLPEHGWSIGQEIYAGNAAMANKKALKVLQNGAERVRFVIPSETVDSSVLLKNIDLKRTSVYLEMRFLSEAYMLSVLEVAEGHEDAIYFNIDIIGNLARTGNWYTSLEKDHRCLDLMLKTKAQHILSVDVSLYENAGANMVQQLGYAMAHTNEYLNHVDQDGSGHQIKSMVFKVAVGGNYFFEIAKLRALRVLWENLISVYSMKIACHILAYPSKRNKTLYDYNVNMLRTTTECMSAVLGGANTIINMPYDALYHKSNDFGERIAINQLLVLKEESYFDKVGNAPDGSYYIESLTDQLAEKGLELLKSIEKGGGFLKQLKNHTIQGKIKESANKQQERFTAQEEVLVGTNKFQNEMDTMKENLELYPFVKTKARKTLIVPIIEKRLAESIEQNRLKDE
ncbi:methylmalonyl-CoA mutase subunit beta [Maribacter chungangensis]|uniref:Methylmalonyl-CoA mutase subunit beta n=1 Tax=Maribacter chungangensis TaxID=1069117 RepID=A0ABW3AYG0_9FLAO